MASCPDPLNGESLGRTTGPTKLSWEPAKDAVEYKLYFGDNADNLELLDTVKKSTTIQSPVLKELQKYYWRVDVKRPDGSTARGERWRFSTGEMVAWWKLDSAEAQVTQDYSGNDFHAKLVGDAQIVSDPDRGNVLSLDGSEDYVDCGVEPMYNTHNSITVSAWVKVNRFDNEYESIISKGNSAWRLQRNRRTGSMTFGCTGLILPQRDDYVNQWGAIYGNQTVEDKKWHHVVGVYDGKKTALYVDGVLDISEIAEGRIVGNDKRIYIGANAGEDLPGGRRHWNGRIDDVRIYSYALTEDEIHALMEETGNMRAARRIQLMAAVPGQWKDRLSSTGLQQGKQVPTMSISVQIRIVCRCFLAW